MKNFSLILLLVFALSGVSASAAPVPVLDWVASFDGSGLDYTGSVITDDNGNIYSLGYFASTVDFDPGASTAYATSSGSGDVFFTKLTADGIYQWVKTWGGTGDDTPMSLDFLNNTGFLFSGRFSGTIDSDPGEGTSYATSSGGYDLMISKFSEEGTFEWSRTWGGTGADFISDAEFDTNGNVYAASVFSGTVDFDPGAGTAYATSSGSYDVALSYFSPEGILQWVKTWGGTGDEGLALSLSVMESSDVYVAAVFSGTVDFDPGAGTAYATSSGSYDAYVSKFSSDGTFQWVKTWGGTGRDAVTTKILGAGEDVYVFGDFANAVDFDPGAGTAYATSSGSADVFVSKLDEDGTHQWTKTLGGAGGDYVQSASLDAEGNIYLKGNFEGTVDFDPGVNTYSITSSGSSDSFILALTSDGEFIRAIGFGSSGIEFGDGLAIDDDKLYSSGWFQNTVDFDLSGNTESKTASGLWGGYLTAFDIIEPDVSVSSVTGSIREGQDGTASYSVVLTTYPTEDVVITATPDAQVTVSPTTLTFSTTTWDVPQTVTISPVDDEDEEGIHSGTITHSVTTGDPDYDGFTVPSVTVSVLDNDRSVSSGSSRRTTTTTTTPQDESVEPAPAEPAPETPMTPEERAAKIEEIKSALITLITQLIAALQKQIAEMSA